ncbi:S-methyl-5-thioribose-1-phosphate isomerase [Halopseudomonas sp.]|uniref:S-methyl-5-thioribose-1-phosphate isomerase n=1 Tax=Halopseudomonas sp. TaxID=2901191 RepID=UPI0035665DBA
MMFWELFMQQAVQPVVADSFSALAWRDNALRLLDQRLLPASEVYVDCTDAAQVAAAIRDMLVRGAPAIGIAGAYGIALQARFIGQSDDWSGALAESFALLEAARPTAVNLSWALKLMRDRLGRLAPDADVPARLLEAARSIHQSDHEANLTMGKLGMQLIRKHHKTPQNLLTHCNTGALATGGYGTALGVIRAAHEAGLVDTVFIDETRPWLQGSRLTAWEMQREGISACVHVDAAAGHLMKTREITWVIVGADRIAANGDVINKIGTYALSILAMHHGLRFMVVAPSSSIDMALENADDVIIEERSANELLMLGDQSVDTGVPAFNPVFDVTPADLVDAIVTEKGVIERPDAKKLADLMSHRHLH